jgi:hypothetical protein
VDILVPTLRRVNWTKVDPARGIQRGLDQRPRLLDRLPQLAERGRMRAVAVEVRDDYQRRVRLELGLKRDDAARPAA